MSPKRRRAPSTGPSPRPTKRRGHPTRQDPTGDEATVQESNNADTQTTPADIDPEIPEVVRSQPYSGPKAARTQLALSLPPLYKLEDIYKSLTTRALELDFDGFLAHLGSRPLRVVTVCSGTESPLLALEMVQDNLRKHFDRGFDFRHLFSAEIVPFKQAYIERNFHPPLIFRDVAELKDRVAQTAYGSLEKIPKNADILVAGFSCVDFSGLNNKRKTLDEKGESGGTFWGIIRYAKTYRPRMVILENVKTAPWEKIEKHWNEIDYFAVHMDVDTKAYYLPQTRERGYMFCVDRRLLKKNHLSEEDMQEWSTVFARFKRPASSPAGMFLIDSDNRRLEQIEKDMALRISSSTSRATVNWAKYQVRHQSYRLNQNLGHKRPVSKSQDNGTCQMPDFAWQTWVKSLPERVWDTLDVNFLRKLVEGYDMNYKERCIELSQGLDREIDSRAYGIVGCITPCGIPYITTRGGPLCGLESLALQGLPLDRLLLTRETQRELQDLAGNAMSSTVVGAAVLSALIVGHKVLKKGQPSPGLNKSVSKHKILAPRDDYDLTTSNVKLSQIVNVNMTDLQTQAASSARYCMCERQSAIKRNISRCTLCEHTSCSECGGNPSHKYERWTSLSRSQPLDFASNLKSILPARLIFNGVSRAHYDAFNTGSSLDCPPVVWDNFLGAVSRAVGDELRFLDIKRSEIWTVVYEGKSSFLHLVIGATGAKWVFFAKPSDSDPALCLNREILSKPIARMTPILGSLFEGDWEVCAPISSGCALNIFGTGSQIQSYEARCGLEMRGFFESKVWTHLTIQGSDEAVQDLEVDIRGTYELLPDCGAANASLHKKAATKDSPAVYLFLDPTKLGEPKNDSLVFSLDNRRITGYSSRLTVAELTHKWRSSKASEEGELVNVYYRRWIKIPSAVLEPYSPGSPISCCHLKPGTTLSIGDVECRDANITLLSFSAPATAIDSLWHKGPWEVTDPTDSPELLRNFSWLLQRAAGLSDFRDWSKVTHEQTFDRNCKSICDICVPPKPSILWGRDRKGRIKAYEDPRDAALYERQVKARPSPFLIFRQVDDHDVGSLRVTLNVQTLLHQAYDKLVDSTDDNNVSLCWRLVPNAYDARNLIFPKFSLVSNRQDTQSRQPPSFLLNLRPEQLRSLSWMIEQEQDEIAPFDEEETEETLLPLMLWRAEGRATIQKVVRGGVLADDVGYGKTAIILGLIDSQYEKAQQYVSEPKDGLIPSKATLIVVPHVMVHQWQSEITKFVGSQYKVIVFQSAGSFSSKTIRDVKNADIILVSWSVFNNAGYYQKMHKFTGMPRVPIKAGRNFDDWFHDAQASLKTHVQILMNQGPHAMLGSIRMKRQTVKNTQADFTYVPSKRLRGKQYADANQYQRSGTEYGVHYAELSSNEEESGNSDDEDPEKLRANIDQYMKLRPSQEITINKADYADELAGTDQEEYTEYEDSSTESRVRQDCGPGKKDKKRKNGKPTTVKNGAKRWDDRKEFNINQAKTAQDWEIVKTPLLHAFSFNRLVIDEFTYANPERLAPLLSLKAHSKWILSGTPPLNDFADVKTIAPFLGIHLGVDDDEEGQSQNKRLKVICKQRSDAEAFQAFRAPRSEAWHRRRHEVAQRFLDRFARKNIAEIDEIPFTEYVVLVPQSSAETAIYLELYKQLMAQNRQLRRSSKSRFSSDQVERLDEIIGSSATAEEALLKRCSSLALQGRWDNGKPEVVTCESLISIREKQLADVRKDILKKLKLAAWIYCGCDLRYENFHNFIESIVRHDFGDITVTEQIYPLIKNAIFTSANDDWQEFFVDSAAQNGTMAKETQESQSEPETDDSHDEDDDDNISQSPVKKAKLSKSKKSKSIEMDDESYEHSSPPTKGRGKGKTGKGTKKDKLEVSTLPNKPKRPREFEPILREVTTTIRNLIVEWVLRERALRFLKTVRLVQFSSEIPSCHSCEEPPETLDEISVLGSCGHALCAECISDVIEKEECVVEGCHGSGKRFNVMNASTLGRDEDRSSMYGGSKMDKLVEIIRSIPTDERAILFVQFPDLMEISSKALDLAKIKYTAISATDRRSAQKVEQFQKVSFGEDKVLILNLGSEMAAGLNLQCANHVIFLSPLLTPTQYDYDSAMTQAIGRSRRYGQTRHVHVYHLLAKKTIDVNIYQERREKVLVERNGEAILVSQDEALESE
ncbi:hypothetical protein MW887_003309, partial [Aspergillus wentii]